METYVDQVACVAIVLAFAVTRNSVVALFLVVAVVAACGTATYHARLTWVEPVAIQTGFVAFEVPIQGTLVVS